ncbi:MAG: IclR family transcriptional regulator [Oscillospiraceae bacterium]|jgi:DNA-binding IclR family transcriptional regulator
MKCGVEMISEQEKEFQKRLSSYSSLKALQILFALSSCGDYVGIHTLAEITGLNASTLHRILQELAECGFVEKDEQQKKYSIGFETMILADYLKNSNFLLEACAEEMNRLNELTKETINLIVLDGYQGTYIGKREAINQITMRSKIGWRIPLYCTGGGKLLLAFQSEKWLEDYLNATPLYKYTENTIVDKDCLKRELQQIRRQNYSIDNREHHPDVVCIAAPIFSRNHTILAAISVAAPTYRFSLEKALSYKDDVIAAGKAITELISK